MYRGVAIFGFPGSGKTSTAEGLVKNSSRRILLETSRDIILPLLNSSQLPDSLNKIAAQAAASISHGALFPLLSYEEFRISARYLFANLSAYYGPDWVARVIEGVHAHYPNKFLVISGVRGIENARRLFSAGYLVTYLAGSKEVFAERRARRDAIDVMMARQEQEREEAIYHTGLLDRFALEIDSAVCPLEDVCKIIEQKAELIDCKLCVNNSINPTLTFSEGLCSVCRRFKESFDPAKLAAELEFVRSFRGASMKVMVGMSGGKDSSAAAFLARELGLKPLGFTFDIGYYPDHIFGRAGEVADLLGIQHEVISIKRHISSVSRESYRLTADLYDLTETAETSILFRNEYSAARNFYSVKNQKPLAYVRSCQLCRKTVIPAYYAEAVERGAKLVILGINEWAGFSQCVASDGYVFSGIRRLKPFRNKPSVYIVHLPFIFRMTKERTQEILAGMNWQPPMGEDFVESNANSCLLARAAEGKASRMLGFHPDSTRLAREATVGFLAKDEAKLAIGKEHPFPLTVRDVLSDAGLLS